MGMENKFVFSEIYGYKMKNSFLKNIISCVFLILDFFEKSVFYLIKYYIYNNFFFKIYKFM